MRAPVQEFAPVADARPRAGLRSPGLTLGAWGPDRKRPAAPGRLARRRARAHGQGFVAPPARPAPARPPPSTAGAGRLAGTEPGPGDAEHHLQQASSEISGALSTRAAATAIRQGMASCTTPSRASRPDRAARPRRAAPAAGSAAPTARRRAAPRGSMSAPAPARPFRCCSSVQLMAAATGTASATAVPSRWRASPPLTSLPYIQAMPAPASAIGAPGALRQPVAEGGARQQRGEQRRDGHRDQHIGHRGQRQRDHEGGVHHAPAQPRHPQRAAAAAQRCATAAPGRAATTAAPPAPGVEAAAPEGDLEAARRLELARDHAGDAPHQCRRASSATPPGGASRCGSENGGHGRAM